MQIDEKIKILNKWENDSNISFDDLRKELSNDNYNIYTHIVDEVEEYNINHFVNKIFNKYYFVDNFLINDCNFLTQKDINNITKRNIFFIEYYPTMMLYLIEIKIKVFSYVDQMIFGLETRYEFILRKIIFNH